MVVLDIYDDPTALILARRIAESGIPLQEKLASSTLLSDGDLAALPDRLFALVGRTSEGTLLRKYAMHDEPHVLTSIAYFLECGAKLPEAVYTKVAGNLLNSCAWYDIDPPEQLVRAALEKTAGEQVMNPGKNWDPAKAAGTLNGTKAEDAKKSPAFVSTKVADLNGTSAVSMGSLRNDPRSPVPERKGIMAKAAMLELGNLTTKKVATVRAAEHFALPAQGKYPIDDAAQVKQASKYYLENATEFSLSDRHTYAHNVAARASELGVKVASAIMERAGSGYGDYIQSELSARARALDGMPYQPAFTALLEKQASINPETMVTMLAELDKKAGLDRSYGRPATGFRDPYLAVYGTKVAEAKPFEWIHEGYYTNEGELTALRKRSLDFDKLIGMGFSARFSKDPVGAFKSLSTDQKVVVCRLANEAC